MKKVYSAIITLLIISMLLGALAGCASEKNPAGAQQDTQVQQTEPQGSQTTVPEQTEPGDTQPEATEPGETDPPTEPETPAEPTAPTEPEATQPPAGTGVTYLEYYAMSAEDQQAFIDSFGSLDAFFAWHTAAKEEYESGRTPIDGGTLNP